MQDQVAGPPTIFRDIIMSDHSTVTTAHINAFSACLSNIDIILETFLAMEVVSIRCLPVFNFVRVAYSLVILIKIYFSAKSKDSELSSIINGDDLRVSYFIDSLLQKFRAVAAEDRNRPAAKFLVVLVMLKGWFVKQNQDNSKNGASPAPKSRGSPSASGSASVAPESSHQQQAPPQQQMANTPLHLLSEIATNDRTRTQSTPSNGNGNNVPWGFNLRQASQQQQPPPGSFMYDSSDTATPTTGEAATNPLFPPSSFPNPGSAADFSPFNVNDLTQNLSMEELAASLGLGDGAGLPGAGPGFLGSFNPAYSGVTGAAAVEPAMAQDPWFGQWGDALGGVPPPGGGPSSAWGGMPPFQM